MGKLKKIPTEELELELARSFVSMVERRFDQDDLVDELVKRQKGEPVWEILDKRAEKDSVDDIINREVSRIIAVGLCEELGLDLEFDE